TEAPRDGPAVFVGRLVPTKGLRVLVEAVARAPGVDVVVVGEGPERRRLERLARARGVSDRVRFAGAVPDDARQALLARARFVVHPALQEALGLAVAEAMRQGCPIVATTAGGIPDVTGDAARLVPPGDAEALARAMVELWSDPALARRLGERARRRAQDFSWPRYVAATLRVYERACASDGRDAPAARAPLRYARSSR
ncbi:MAG TPA: glycosyltransferase, partial [Candidatus Thermoplasmatota archaeon]|nr:glycosyltransferase [Candidatus Thermoplasmatota archaeon]